MTIKECYEKVGGDYADVLKRFESEKIIMRFLTKFLTDKSFCELEASLKENSTDKAFLAAHTLKGVCINLGFNNLYRTASDITELLRNKDKNDINRTEYERLFDKAKGEYTILIDAIQNLDD